MGLLRQSFYLKISGALFVLMAIMVAVMIFLLDGFWKSFALESDQLLHWDLAQVLATRLEPEVTGKINYAAVQESLNDFSTLFPRFEFFLLDEEGTIMSYQGGANRLRVRKIRLEPIRKFLNSAETPTIPIFGDNPHESESVDPSVFSVAPMQVAGKTWYFYVLLNGEKGTATTSLLSLSYVRQSSIAALAFTFIVTFLLGSTLFFFLTRRLRSVAVAVKAFESGDLGRRMPDSSDDEVGQLARAFNSMADAIAGYIEKLKRGDELRRELVANVSHDLRSPLTSAQGYMEVLLSEQDKVAPEERAAFLERTYQTIIYLVRLVNELFELSKLEAKDTVPKLAAFSAMQLTELCCLKYEPLAAERNVTIQLDSPDDIPKVVGDRYMIERVVSNLIENAIRYNRENGTVTVRLAAHNGRLTISVKDTGIGIAQEELPHIFERLYRARQGNEHSASGSGLGLAIVRRIIEAHASEILVNSTLGQGTEFSFELPTE